MDIDDEYKDTLGYLQQIALVLGVARKDLISQGFTEKEASELLTAVINNMGRAKRSE